MIVVAYFFLVAFFFQNKSKHSVNIDVVVPVLEVFWFSKRIECLPMVRKTWVQSQVGSYQRLLKWYLIPPCLTLSNIRYVSRVKWSNLGKEVAPSPTPRCSSYRRGSLLVALDYGRQFNRLIGLVGRLFANGLGDLGSTPGRVIPKILKMVLDTFLLNTQQFKVRIKSKVEQSSESSSALPYTSV